MNEDYFNYVVSRLSIDELTILGILESSDATVIFKSIKRSSVIELSGLSQANFRKCIYKLTANMLIEKVTNNKEHSLYITEYGLFAIQKSMEGVV